MNNSTREFKFRVFNKVSEEMCYFDFDSILEKKDCLYSIHDVYCTSNVTMQFTGTNDMEGAPIYEGDVIEYKDYSGGAYIFGKQPLSRDVVRWNTQRGGYKVSGGGMWFEGKKYRVIGNIYETPHLLGDSHE